MSAIAITIEICPSPDLSLPRKETNKLIPQEATEQKRDANLSLSEATREFQISFIRKKIKAAHGNISEAARCMKLHRSNLYRKMRQLGVKGD